MTYIDNLKYEHFMEDIDLQFSEQKLRTPILCIISVMAILCQIPNITMKQFLTVILMVTNIALAIR